MPHQRHLDALSTCCQYVHSLRGAERAWAQAVFSYAELQFPHPRSVGFLMSRKRAHQIEAQVYALLGHTPAWQVSCATVVFGVFFALVAALLVGLLSWR